MINVLSQNEIDSLLSALSDDICDTTRNKTHSYMLTKEQLYLILKTIYNAQKQLSEYLVEHDDSQKILLIEKKCFTELIKLNNLSKTFINQTLNNIPIKADF